MTGRRRDTERNRIARRLLADGANREELIEFGRAVAYDTLFSMGLDPSGNDGVDSVSLLPGPCVKQPDRALGDNLA